MRGFGPQAGEVARSCEKVATAVVRVDRRDDQQGEFRALGSTVAMELLHQNKFWPRREETAFFPHQRLAEAVS